MFWKKAFILAAALLVAWLIHVTMITLSNLAPASPFGLMPGDAAQAT